MTRRILNVPRPGAMDIQKESFESALRKIDDNFAELFGDDPARAVGDHILLVAAGQSNMVGYTAPNGVDYNLDTQDARVTEMVFGLGPNLIADGKFGKGVTTGWTPTACTLAVDANGWLVATKNNTSGFPQADYAISGLTVGNTYEIGAEIEANDIQVTARIVSPATTIFLGTAGYPTRRGKLRFVATATTATFRVLSQVNTQANGSVAWRARDLFVREVLTTGINERTAVEPLWWPDALSERASYGTSPAAWCARELIRLGAARKVSILPVAVGGTGLYGSVWASPSGSQLVNAKNLLTAALAYNPRLRPILLWQQGEWDATAAVTESQYTGAFSTMLADLRSVSGAGSMPCLVAGLVPEYIAVTPNLQVIDGAHKLLSSQNDGVAFVPSLPGYQKSGEAFHFSQAGARLNGRRWANAIVGNALPSA